MHRLLDYIPEPFFDLCPWISTIMDSHDDASWSAVLAA